MEKFLEIQTIDWKNNLAIDKGGRDPILAGGSRSREAQTGRVAFGSSSAHLPWLTQWLSLAHPQLRIAATAQS